MESPGDTLLQKGIRQGFCFLNRHTMSRSPGETCPLGKASAVLRGTEAVGAEQPVAGMREVLGGPAWMGEPGSQPVHLSLTRVCSGPGRWCELNRFGVVSSG